MNRIMTTAIVTLLAGGVAVGAYKSGLITPYADVVSSTPVTVQEPVYVDVLSTTPVSQTVNSTQQVCENRTVQKRAPTRFRHAGTIIGVVAGGLLGNQFGGGSGRALATVGGAVAGGYVGHEIDEHRHGRLYTTSEQVCSNEPTTKEQIIGYDVRYRNGDGQILTRREDSDPGKRLWLGDKDVIVGYDVNWRYKDQTGTIRMDEKPGDRLPMSNGAIVVANKESTPAKG
jgi:uncharacterized protein YcfJ